MSIVVKNITKLYGEQKALDDVSFEIRTGQIVGFLGPNGAGKSTMMKILTGYIPPTSGSAKVCGFDILTQSMEVKRNVGYLPESNPLYGDMYVKEYLYFVAGMHGIRSNVNALVARMIEMTGLGIEQKKKIRMLSKGYKQRVGLAQALIHDPKVLILDEPTSGLDPNQLVEIRNLIKELGKQKTVMLSTHIMQEVEAMCEQVIIINRGKIEANQTIASIQQVLSNNKEYIEVEFDSMVNETMLLSIPGVTGVKNHSGNLWVIESGKGQDIRGSLFQWAVANQVTVLTLKKHETSLEEVFQQVTRKKK
jgi:ABC-2 type transport system ATP-binding protein